MSKFMDYLNNIDKTIEDKIDEVIVEEDVVEISQKTIERDSSVDIIEDRLRTKLDAIGLNTKAINEVVSYVLSNTIKVEGFVGVQNPEPVKDDTGEVDKTKQVNENSKVRNNHKSVKSYAESLLDGLPDDYQPIIQENSSINNKQQTQMSNVADRASSLL